MRRFLLVLIAVASSFTLISCATVNTRAGFGLLYSNVKDYTNADFVNTKFTKTGKACATNILGLVLTGDMSLDSAKKDGGIKRVATIDMEGSSILGLYSNVCLVVRGY